MLLVNTQKMSAICIFYSANENFRPRAPCGILILEAKPISVLRSQLPCIQAAPCWLRPFAPTPLLGAVRNVIPKVTRTRSTVSGRSTPLTGG